MGNHLSKGNMWHWYLALHSCMHKSHAPTNRHTHIAHMHTIYVHRHKHKHIHSRHAYTHKHIYCIHTETNTKQINIHRHTDRRQTDAHTCVERDSWQAAQSTANLLTSCLSGSTERQRKEQGLKILSKWHFQWPNFFHLSPKSYRFYHISKYQPLGDQDFYPWAFVHIWGPKYSSMNNFLHV